MYKACRKGTFRQSFIYKRGEVNLYLLKICGRLQSTTIRLVRKQVLPYKVVCILFRSHVTCHIFAPTYWPLIFCQLLVFWPISMYFSHISVSVNKYIGPTLSATSLYLELRVAICSWLPANCNTLSQISCDISKHLYVDIDFI